MKKIIIILAIVLLMGCTTLRYGDDLKEPYTQTEIEITSAGAIIITAFGIFTAGVIYNEVK